MSVSTTEPDFRERTMSEIYDHLPEGYRWMTAEEVEAWTTTPGVIQVRVGGTDDDPWTDLAVRS